MISRDVDLIEIQSRLINWLQQKMPKAHNISIADIERSGAGFSSDTFLFNLLWEERGKNKTQGMVLRCAPQSYHAYLDYDISKQYRIMECLQDTNVPVPKIHWLETDERVLGTPFFLMEKIDGLVPPEFPPYHVFGVCYDAPPDQRTKMWWGSLQAMVKAHKLDWKTSGLSFLGVPGAGTDPIDQELDYWDRTFNWVKEEGEQQPIMEATLDWLKANHYIPERVTLCWGDARLPNTMYSHNGDVLALLDWEQAYLGDPENDLGWFLALDWHHSEGMGMPRLEGFPQKEEAILGYEKLTGWEVKHSLYNEIMAFFRVNVIMLKLFKNWKSLGVSLPSEDIETNNICTRRLANLLDLPSPGEPDRAITSLDAVTVKLQFHLTGKGGSDWYLVSESGHATRYEGTVENPNATLTVSASDWAAIQSGELDRVHAWLGGQLKIDGDMFLFSQLEDTIAKMANQ